MIFYKANFNTDGSDFPATAAINVSVPSAGDGTEFIALMVNDHWGARQALMNYAGLNPNATSEVYNNSQFLEALTLCFGYPGEVIAWHGQVDPATLGLRLLLLKGQTVQKANYPELDAVVYCGDGNNPTWEYYYHCDNPDGTGRNPAGIYLVLADMRGAFARGDDPTDTRDPKGSTRDFPDFQNFAVQNHYHRVLTEAGSYRAMRDSGIASGTGVDGFSQTVSAGTDRLNARTIESINGIQVLFDNDETRAANVQVKWCVRY